MAFAPGSFTKNFGWNLSPPRLHALYVAIRAGFGGVAHSVTRDHFRSHCGISDPDRQLIPINFFLHNTVIGRVNYVTPDELVRHAINNPHSRRFDQLALFTMHLTRLGRRLGKAGDPRGAAFTNDFVRNRLWNSGGWESGQLTEWEVERAFKATIQATGAYTVHKCMTNYVFMMEMMGLKDQRTRFINTHIDEWVGPGLFLAFDRYALDRTATATLRRDDLLSMVRADELHKLMGTTEAYLDSVAPLLVDEYLELGGLGRVTSPAVLDAAGEVIVSSPVAPRRPAAPPATSVPDRVFLSPDPLSCRHHTTPRLSIPIQQPPALTRATGRARVSASAPGECRKSVSHYGTGLHGHHRSILCPPCNPMYSGHHKPLPLPRRSNTPAVRGRL
jgi:hypothetical protein